MDHGKIEPGLPDPRQQIILNVEGVGSTLIVPINENRELARNPSFLFFQVAGSVSMNFSTIARV